MKVLVILAFIGILGSLGSALFFMLRGGRGNSTDEGDSDIPSRRRNMARALAFRVGFSVLLFICLIVAWALGWVTPTGIPAGR